MRVLHRHDYKRPIIVVNADFEDCRDFVTNLSGQCAKWSGTSLRIDNGNGVADARTDIFREANADGDLPRSRCKLIDIAAHDLGRQIADVLGGVAPHQNRLNPSVETGQEGLFDKRRGANHARCLQHFLKDVFPIVHAPAVGLNDGMAIEAYDLVQQFCAKAVHDAHHHDKHGNRQHHDTDGDARDKRNKCLALARKQVAFGDGPFERREDQDVPCLCLQVTGL